MTITRHTALAKMYQRGAEVENTQSDKKGSKVYTGNSRAWLLV